MKPHTIPTLLAAAVLLSAKAGNLCKPGERVVESCTGKHKIASVCASPQLTPSKGYLQYRFGTSKKIELTIPATPQPVSSYVHADHFSGTGGGSTYFGFQHGDFSYVFYTYWRKPDWGANPDNPSCHGPCDGNGMAVMHAGAVISKLACERGSEGSPLSNDEIDALGITPSDDMIVE
ncbi:MAG: hypothetical protein JO218_12040 [Burkholderiales bacterium]|nr:hypothetical protein [Burkholderiales bacterium]